HCSDPEWLDPRIRPEPERTARRALEGADPGRKGRDDPSVGTARPRDRTRPRRGRALPQCVIEELPEAIHAVSSPPTANAQGWGLRRRGRVWLGRRVPAVTVAAADKGGYVVDEQAEADMAPVRSRADGGRKVRQVGLVESGDSPVDVLRSCARVCRQRSKLAG